MMLCEQCDRLIDTDDDPDAFVEKPFQKYDWFVWCKWCREAHEMNEVAQ